MNLRRDTLLDFFNDLSSASSRIPDLRRWVSDRRYTYAEIARMARASPAACARPASATDQKDNPLQREPARMGRGAVGLPAGGRGRGAARLSGLGRVRDAAFGIDCRGAGDPGGRRGGSAAAGGHRLADRGAWTWTARMPRFPLSSRNETAEIIFTSGATAEPEGRGDHPPQRAGQHRAGRARSAEVPRSGRGRSRPSGF